MKQRLIGLLRGINVGKAKRIAMADLRALMEELGYTDVRTLLNSGNVVFTANRGTPDAIAARIEKAMPERLGVAAKVFVLTAAELAAIVADNPVVVENPSRFLVSVVTAAADLDRLAPLVARSWDREVLATGGRVAYLSCPDGILTSQLVAAVARALGDRTTARNWATIEKLHTMAC